MRGWADNVGVAIGVGLLAVVGVASAMLEAGAPHTPNVFTGHVYALPLPLLRRVYVTELQHDLIAMVAVSGIATILVGLVLSPAIRRRRR